jgi:hypothetical protein
MKELLSFLKQTNGSLYYDANLKGFVLKTWQGEHVAFAPDAAEREDVEGNVFILPSIYAIRLIADGQLGSESSSPDQYHAAYQAKQRKG